MQVSSEDLLLLFSPTTFNLGLNRILFISLIFFKFKQNKSFEIKKSEFLIFI